MKFVKYLYFIIFIMFFLISVFSFEEITDYQNLVKRLKEESYNYFNESWSSFVNFNNTNKNGTIYYVSTSESDQYILLSVLKDNGKYYLCNRTALFSYRNVTINGKRSLVFCENGLIRATHFQNFASGRYALNAQYLNVQSLVDNFGRIVPGLSIENNKYVAIETGERNINTINLDSFYNFTLVDDLDDDSSGLGCILHGQFLTEKAPLQGSFVYLGKNLSVSNSGCCGDDDAGDNFIYYSGSLNVACFKGYAFVPGTITSAGIDPLSVFDYYFSKDEKYTINLTKYIYNVGYFNGTNIVYAEYVDFNSINSFQNFTKYYPLNLILAVDNNKLVFAYCKNSDISISNLEIKSVDPLNQSRHYYIEVSSANKFLLKNITNLQDSTNLGMPVFLCDGTQWRYFVNKSFARTFYEVKIFNYTNNNFKPVKSYINQNLNELKNNYFKYTTLKFSGDSNLVHNVVVNASSNPTHIKYNLNTNYNVLFELPSLDRVGFKLIYFNMSR